MFPSAGWELNAGAPLLAKIVPMLAKLQHTEIVVGGYTDSATVGSQLQSMGISNNLDLSCKRAASVVVYLVSKGVSLAYYRLNAWATPTQLHRTTRPKGKAKNRRVDITLTGDGT